MFDRIRDLISQPGSIQDKLSDLQEQVTGGGLDSVQEHVTGSDLAGQLEQFGGLGAVQERLEGIQFPIPTEDLANLLEGRGVPTQITDQLQHLDIAQFQSQSEVLNQISGLLRR